MKKNNRLPAVLASDRCTPVEHTPFCSFNDVHPGFSDIRCSGNAHYVVMRSFVSGDSELVALQMGPDDKMRKGGGATRESTEKSEMTDSVLAKSQGRARRSVRYKCMQINADRMLTLTFRDNVTDIDRAWSCLDYFHRLMRWRYGTKNYNFVVVPEYQKRGAVHFHLAISGFYHANTVRRLWHRAVGALDGNTHFTSPKSIGKNSWNPRRIGQYISKYMTKTDSVEFNKKRYAASKFIPQPVKQTGWMSPSIYPFYMLTDFFIRFSGRMPSKTLELGEGRFPLYFITT